MSNVNCKTANVTFSDPDGNYEVLVCQNQISFALLPLQNDMLNVTVMDPIDVLG